MMPVHSMDMYVISPAAVLLHSRNVFLTAVAKRPIDTNCSGVIV